jgi:hypothetical protein
MARKNEEVKKVVIEKKYDFKFLVEEGGKMNSDIPYKVIYKERFNGTHAEAKNREKELKTEYPTNSVVYFSL